MTEYARPPHMLPDYMSPRERTAHWVSHYSPNEVYSPSIPPTPIEGFNGPPSPAVSTHSLPPKMILRYNDGRGDVPIPHPNPDYHGRSGGRHRMHHSNSGSHTSSPLSPRPHDAPPPPPTPEEIRVLPSRPINNSSSTSSSNKSHTRSKSIPRNHSSYSPQQVPAVPHSRPALAINPTGAQAAYSPWIHPANPAHHSRHGSLGYHATQQHRSPYDPHLFQHPHHVGPDGMIYSHSAPPVMSPHYSPQYPGMYPAVSGDERMGRTREREMARKYTRGKRSDSPVSDESEDTYYMSPTGQKVHVIAHSPERSVDTESSTTKVASHWSHNSVKKPFLSRLFGIGGSKAPVSASHKAGSMPNGRKLHRRHSVDEAHRRPRVPIE